MSGASQRALASANPRGPLTAALAAVGGWLLEPAEPRRQAPVSAPGAMRPVIAVFGLARGCGTTVVARGLAAELAARDSSGAAAVHCDARAAGIPLATPAAGRLARLLADVPGADTRAVGRLCLIGGADAATLADTARCHAPVVVDAGGASLGGAPAAIACEVVIVAGPATAPALALVAADCLARVGHEPIVVVNRAPGEAPDWAGLAAEVMPDSRMGAQLAIGGREARGELGRAMGRLADRCQAGR